VPICLAGTDTDDFLTAEPAVVVQLGSDEHSESGPFGDDSEPPSEAPLLDSPVRRRKVQQGVSLRRATFLPAGIRNRTSSQDSALYEQLTPVSEARMSPFERSMGSLDSKQKVAHGGDWQSRGGSESGNVSFSSNVSIERSWKNEASEAGNMSQSEGIMTPSEGGSEVNGGARISVV
jgi:hypothetical protein